MPRKTDKRKDESVKTNIDKRQTSILDIFAKKPNQKCNVSTSEKVCMGVRSVDGDSDEDVQVISVSSGGIGAKSKYFSHDHAIVPGPDISKIIAEKSSGSKLRLRRSTAATGKAEGSNSMSTGISTTATFKTIPIQNASATTTNCTSSLDSSNNCESSCSLKNKSVGCGDAVTNVQANFKRRVSETNQEKRKLSLGYISQSDMSKTKRSRHCEDVKPGEKLREYSCRPLSCSNSCSQSSNKENSEADTSSTSTKDPGSAYPHEQLDSASAIQMTSHENTLGISPNPNFDHMDQGGQLDELLHIKADSMDRDTGLDDDMKQKCCVFSTRSCSSLDSLNELSEPMESNPPVWINEAEVQGEIVPDGVVSKLKCSNLGLELNCSAGLEVTSKDLSSDLTIIESQTLVGMSQESVINTEGTSQEVESQRTSVESQETSYTSQYLPYYIENFKLVIKTILEDVFFSYLFDTDDLRSTETFCSVLSDEAQKLYVRLFLRKHKWLCARKIQYPKIATDLDPFLKELVDVGLLWDESSLDGLEMCLNLLPADELRGYAKKMHVDVTNQRMPMIVDALLKQSKRKTVGAMFGMKSDLEAIMFRRVKSLVGPCYRLRDAPRLVFLRCMMLFSLTSTAFEDDDQANSQQLFQILQVNRGLITYPTYKIQRTTKIFRYRDDVVRFQTALNIYSEILGAIESHSFDAGVDLYRQAKLLYAEHCADEQLVKFELSLPTFLKVYTAGSVYVRVLNQGVEVLQKVKNYAEANEVLEEVLNQSIHCEHYRGHWWDRLALNLDQHLKSPDKSLDVIGKGLSDACVRSGRRLALYQRSQRICESASNKKLKKRKKEFKHNNVQEAPKVTIQGRLLPKSILGANSHFVSPDGNSEDVTLCRVEQVAISHYKKEGYDQGIHGESSTFFVLLHLYFWDIIFMNDIPDVFYNKYQTAPLDMRTEEFYTNRKRPINKRLKWLKKASEEELLEHLENAWLEHEGQLCAAMNWETFESLEQAKTLVRAFKGKFMSGVFRRIIKDPRHTSSGMPDLVVWNTTDNTFRLVEVKGPGDKLSTKQILWLDYFLALGATAEVCHVVGVGARKLVHSACRKAQDT